MKKSLTIGICAVAALALTMAGCSKNSECSSGCKDKDAATCCQAGEKNADACCKGDASKSCCKKTSDMGW